MIMLFGLSLTYILLLYPPTLLHSEEIQQFCSHVHNSWDALIYLMAVNCNIEFVLWAESCRGHEAGTMKIM